MSQIAIPTEFVYEDLYELRVDLLSDLLFFIRFFHYQLYNREFILSNPVSSTSHFIEMSDALTNVFNLNTLLLWENLPPGWGKSSFCKYFIAWAMAWYPDSKSIYVSYSHDLAAGHTNDIKSIMSLPLYRELFDVEILRASSAKDNFMTRQGGQVFAAGAEGPITGRDAGFPGVDRFSGCFILDDNIKPGDAASDVRRQKATKQFHETHYTRLRGPKVPMIFIGQRTHEDDTFAHIESVGNWKKVIITAEDAAGNPRYPEFLPADRIKILKETQRYVWASQYMQDPCLAGGALYREDDFLLLDEEPEILTSFIVCDTAETSLDWNDATVFSFFGIYEIKQRNLPTGEYALFWLDCREIRVEPRDLKDEFLDFWASCRRHSVKPEKIFVEKKSTGVSLLSELKNQSGIDVRGIDRSVKSNSKAQRFIDLQQYISRKLVTLPAYSRHSKKCIDHMLKITADDTHSHDDIADTCYDAVNIALIDKIIVTKDKQNDYNKIASMMNNSFKSVDNLRNKAYGNSSSPFSRRI